MRDVVVADIGGTHSRLALLDDDGRPGAPALIDNGRVAGMEAMLRSYLSAHGLGAGHTTLRLAVAAPVAGDIVRLTNRDWVFSASALQRALGLATVSVVNDFTAVALSLPRLNAGGLLAIGSGQAACDAPKVVLGPGTGLGVAAAVPLSDAWYPIASEGGHASLTPYTQEDERVIACVRETYGHVSAERLLSGPGLSILYETECRLGGRGAQRKAPEDVTRLALSGQDPVAVAVLERFFSLLGGVAGDLALVFGARGGVYLAGGILPQLQHVLAASNFRRCFEAKGRFSAYLERVPTYLITHPWPALLGLAAGLPEGIGVHAP